jgi:hypothetical protein
MYFAIRLAFRSIRAWFEMAFVERRVGRVLINIVSIHFLLSQPAVFMVFAGSHRALPRATVSLLMLGQVTRPCELLIASRFAAALWF